MPPKRRVLIVGAAARMGPTLLRGLSDRYDLTGVDLKPVPAPNIHVADVRDRPAVQHLFEGQDTVVSILRITPYPGTWDSAYHHDLPAFRSVFEASRIARVRRVVFASSSRVTQQYEREHPYAAICAGQYAGLDPAGIPQIAADWPIRPTGAYGLVKAFGEAMARTYADEHGLSVLCLRFGTVLRHEAHGPPPADPRTYATGLTARDLVRLVTCCIEAPDALRFGIYPGVSGNTWRFWDLTGARRDLGYEPQDDLERWRPAAG